MTRMLRAYGLVLFWLAGVCVAPPAAGQVFRLVPRQARLGSSYDGTWRTNTGLVDRSFTQNHFRQWLVLPFEGALGRPSLLRYRLELQPTLSQQQATDLPDPLQSRHLAYSADATLFGGSPVYLQTVYTRTSGNQEGGFGTQGEFASTRFSPTLHIQNTLLPITVSYADQTHRTLTQVGPTLTPIEQSDALQTFRLGASNRKIDLAYEHAAFDDRIYENDFVSRGFHLHHTFRWGKRSELLSRVQTTRRTGTLPYERRSWSEQVRLQHTRATYTRLGFQRFSAEGLGGMSSGSSYSWAMFSDIRPWLGIGGDASRSVSRFDGGTQHMTSAGPRMQFGVHLPLGLYLSGGGSVGYLRRDLDDAGGRSIAVLREAYEVDPTGIVVLERETIEPATVVVQRGDETIVYVEGLDYRLIPVGALVQIEVLAGSRIRAGESILVSYRYRPQLDAVEQGTVGQADVGLRVDGISLHHTRSRRATSMEEGLVTGDFNQHQTSFRMQRRLPIGLARLTATHRHRESAIIDYTSAEAMFSLTLPPWRSTTLSLDLTARDVRESADRLVLYAASGVVSWNILSNLQLRATAGYQHWDQRLTGVQHMHTVTGALDYTVGQTQIRAQYAYDRRQLLYLTSGNRFSLYLLRRF